MFWKVHLVNIAVAIIDVVTCLLWSLSMSWFLHPSVSHVRLLRRHWRWHEILTLVGKALLYAYEDLQKDPEVHCDLAVPLLCYTIARTLHRFRRRRRRSVRLRLRIRRRRRRHRRRRRRSRRPGRHIRLRLRRRRRYHRQNPGSHFGS